MRVHWLLLMVLLVFGGCSYLTIKAGIVNSIRLEELQQNMLEAQE